MIRNLFQPIKKQQKGVKKTDKEEKAVNPALW